MDGLQWKSMEHPKTDWMIYDDLGVSETFGNLHFQPYFREDTPI